MIQDRTRPLARMPAGTPPRSALLAPMAALLLALAAPLPASLPAAAQGASQGGAEESAEAPARTRGRAARRSARRGKPAAEPAAEAPAAAESGEAAEPEAKGRGRGRGRGAAKPAPSAPASLQASPVGAYGDWSVFAAGQGRDRICYAISQPKARSPKTLKRDAAYLFVTVRKADRNPSELALMMGFEVKPGGAQTAAAGSAAPTKATTDPTLAIGSANYGLVVKEKNAWLQNPAEEGKVVGEMGRAQKLVVRATSLRGNGSSDEYSLAGFNEAMKRTREECK